MVKIITRWYFLILFFLISWEHSSPRRERNIYQLWWQGEWGTESLEGFFDTFFRENFSIILFTANKVMMTWNVALI